MNKYLKNKKMILFINVFFLIVASFLLIYGLVKYIQSYSFYQDEYGTDISFNNDYLIMLLGGLMMLTYNIYSLKVNLSSHKDEYFEIFITTFHALFSFYPLGVFFKALFKAISKNKSFDFQGNVIYLVLGLIFLIYLIISICLCIQNYKLNKNK